MNQPVREQELGTGQGPDIEETLNPVDTRQERMQ